MWKRLLLLFPFIVIAAHAGIVRDYAVFREGGTVVLRKKPGSNNDEAYYLMWRVTCKKAADGKGGVAGTVEVVLLTLRGVPQARDTKNLGRCPDPDDVERAARNIGILVTPDDIFSQDGSGAAYRSAARLARIEPLPDPAGNRIYVADRTGLNGRTALDVFDPGTAGIVATIDVNDRLFGGVAVSSYTQRAYALMWQTSLPPSPGPAFIAYIDTKTNTIVDRFLLADLLDPQRPALSADGRYLYFSARTQTVGQRVQVVDLERKVIAGVLPAPVPTNSTVEPRAVELSPDGALLCAAAQAGVLCYDVRTRTLLGRVPISLPNTALRPVFHPNGSRMYVLGRTSTPTFSNFISVIDTATLTEVTRIPITNPAFNDFRDGLARLSITPDGSRLVLDESFQGTMNIVDTVTNKIIKTVVGLTTGGLGSTVIVNR